MLRLSNIHVNYGAIPALRGISLEVDQGEVVGLIGANGAGKTTTLGAIVGQVHVNQGDISFRGHSLVGQLPERIVRRGIALVPEGRRIFGSLSVAENLEVATTTSADRAESRREIRRVLERFPVLERYYSSSAAKLSGGEQQQLAIARALLCRPQVLLLDEPSLGLAPQMIDLVFEIMGELKQEGVTLLLVEQNARRTLEFADRTYVLRNGRIALSGTRDDLRESEDVEEIYLGIR